MMKPVVIYIAGYGRSGSSALSRALAQDNAVLSAGELGRLPTFIRNDEPCSCGEPVSKCPVWRNAMIGTINDAMEAVAHANFSVVVDSSKTAYRDFQRPFLYRMNGYRVILVHLKRPLRGVLDSTRKGTNKNLEVGNNKQRAFNTIRTVIGYAFAHLAAVANRLICRESIQVKHGEMLKDISNTVNAILQPVIVLITHGAAKHIESSAIHGMHEIAGNRLLRGNSHGQ